MSAFQILDKENNPISIKELDRQAADFWNKKVDSKYYANPSKIEKFSNPDNLTGEELLRAKMKFKSNQIISESLNWFDVIGWTIAHKGDYTTGWHNVVNDLISETLGQCFIDFKDKATIKVAEFERKSGDTTLSLPGKTGIKLYHTLEYYKPYIQLINHWMSKGYKPRQIKEC